MFKLEKHIWMHPDKYLLPGLKGCAMEKKITHCRFDEVNMTKTATLHFILLSFWPHFARKYIKLILL